MKKLISITALLFILNVNLNFGQNKTVLNNKSNLEYFLSNSINDTINKTLKKRALSCDSVFCLVSAQKNYYGGTLFEIDTKDMNILEYSKKYLIISVEPIVHNLGNSGKDNFVTHLIFVWFTLFVTNIKSWEVSDITLNMTWSVF